MIEDKELFICEQIKRIDLNKKEITFSFHFAPYLKETQEEGERLLKLLLNQNIDYWSRIPIRGLCLRWSEYSEEDLK
jgi:hypothetical protein